MFRILYGDTLIKEVYSSAEVAWDEIQDRVARYKSDITSYRIVQLVEYKPITQTIIVFEKV